MIPDSQTSSMFFKALESDPPFSWRWSKAKIDFIGCVSRVRRPRGKNSKSLDRITLLYAHTHLQHVREHEPVIEIPIARCLEVSILLWICLAAATPITFITSSRLSSGSKLALANANLYSLSSKAMLCSPSDDSCDTQPRKLCQTLVSP